MDLAMRQGSFADFPWTLAVWHRGRSRRGSNNVRSVLRGALKDRLLVEDPRDGATRTQSPDAWPGEVAGGRYGSKMSTFPDAGRRVGHIMLDVLTAYDIGGSPDNGPRMQLAMNAINDVEAAVKMIRHDDGTLELDASDVSMPGIILINWMLEMRELDDGQDRHLMIAEMREYLDS